MTTYQVRALFSPTGTHVYSVHGTKADALQSLSDVKTLVGECLIGWDVERFVIVAIAPDGTETVI